VLFWVAFLNPDIFSHMLARQFLLDNIITKLSFVKAKVEISNPLNLTDVNLISENFYRDLLNLIFGYSLQNINILEPNSAFIDLGDRGNKICFQVTSISTLEKTRKTVSGYIKKNLHRDFDRLIILNIASKSNHRDPQIGNPGIFELDTKNDIWDISTILKAIGDLPDIKRLESISQFLDENIKFENVQSVAKEIVTFMSLIIYLSDESQPSAGAGFIEEPDPDKKIHNRFSTHAAFLTKEYADLYTEFGLVLTDVLKQSDMGQVRVRRLALHLKNESDTILTDQKNDPQKALEVLTDRYEKILKEKGSVFDRSAIRFFLIDQLIKCNVFPNKVLF
jgi:hypothetical protein